MQQYGSHPARSGHTMQQTLYAERDPMISTAPVWIP